MKTGITAEIASKRRQIRTLSNHIKTLKALEITLDQFPECCNVHWMSVNKPMCDITLSWIEDIANPVSLDERENIILDILDRMGYAPFPYPYDCCGSMQYRIDTYNRQYLQGYNLKFSIILGKEVPKAYKVKEEHTAYIATRFVFTCDEGG
mgnify:CR=1 FL=1